MFKGKFNIKALFNKVWTNPTLINIFSVGIISIIIKVFGFYKEVVVAESFGLSELLDTFFIAALVPGFVSSVFLQNFNSVFIPNYISEQNSTKNISAFQSTSLVVTVGTAIFFMLLAYLFNDVYLETFFAGHTEQYYDLVIIQFHYLLPCILFWGLTSILSGLLNIHDEFVYSSIHPILTTLAIIICLFFFQDVLQERVLAVGTLIGSIAQFLFLLIVAMSKNIVNLGIPDFSSQNAIMMFKQVPAKVSSGILSGVNPLVDQFFSAQLIIGSITALNYGVKIPSFVIGIIASALGNVLLPYFSKSALADREAAFKKLKNVLKYLLYGSCGAALIVILLSSPIISILFERGAFTSADTFKVSKIQQMYALQIPSYMTGVVMVKFLTSINKNNFMVLASFLSLILNGVLNFILIKYMEVYGLALATSLVSIINSIVLYLYICRLNKAHV